MTFAPARELRLTLAVLVAALVGLGSWYIVAVRRPIVVAGVRVGGVEVGGTPLAALGPKLDEVARRWAADPMVLTAGGAEVRITRGELGLSVDRAALAAMLGDIGRSGDPFVDLPARWRARRGRIDVAPPVAVDDARLVEALVSDVKDLVDRAPVDAHLDLERHTVQRESAGLTVDVFASAAAVGAGRQQSRIELVTLPSPPKVVAADLDKIDISTVLGAWETHYTSTGADSDRTYNLKVGADHLNGHILLPGEIFSFNAVVGDRTEKEGYRVAPVISGGELVDGLAGGMCQIASTLHAAAFFAGLDIVKSTPHSRPSAYIPMGLDSTVVYPSVDLQLRNSYAFPIVMHYKVSQGAVRVELLGQSQPYRVVFEREIKSENGFGSQTRHDPTAPPGQRLVLQEGYPGYSLVRRRWIFQRADKVPAAVTSGNVPVEEALAKMKIKLKPKKREQWAVGYPSTQLIVAIGNGPAKLHKKDPPPSHHIPPVRKDDKPIFKITR